MRGGAVTVRNEAQSERDQLEPFARSRSRIPRRTGLLGCRDFLIAKTQRVVPVDFQRVAMSVGVELVSSRHPVSISLTLSPITCRALPQAHIM
jgi:hypothetical protein